MTEEKKLYADRDVVALGRHYPRHVSAMTSEGLHFKSDIAAELAYRDAQIERLKDTRAARSIQHSIITALSEGQGPQPMCRDCADNDGRCPARMGKPCDPFQEALEILRDPKTHRPNDGIERAIEVVERRRAWTADAVKITPNNEALHAENDTYWSLLQELRALPKPSPDTGLVEALERRIEKMRPIVRAMPNNEAASAELDAYLSLQRELAAHQEKG